jgi:glycosyltransferase involved in cell wall biosynthesis
MTPFHIYRNSRLLLVPSVAPEASARVVAEALINGIPVLASERGGLPENCAGGGLTFRLPSSLTEQSLRPVRA